jgi:hypothetical protein
MRPSTPSSPARLPIAEPRRQAASLSVKSRMPGSPTCSVQRQLYRGGHLAGAAARAAVSGASRARDDQSVSSRRSRESRCGAVRRSVDKSLGRGERRWSPRAAPLINRPVVTMVEARSRGRHDLSASQRLASAGAPLGADADPRADCECPPVVLGVEPVGRMSH